MFLNAFVVTLDFKASECCSSLLGLKKTKWQNIKHGEGLKELSLQELLYQNVSSLFAFFVFIFITMG